MNDHIYLNTQTTALFLTALKQTVKILNDLHLQSLDTKRLSCFNIYYSQRVDSLP